MANLGDLFAPAYQAGNPASMQAVSDWQNRVFNVNGQNIDQTRKPVSFDTGNPGGMVDPEALRVLAQGGPYDFDARRNAIAAQVQQQQAAKSVQQALPTTVPTATGGTMPIYGRSGTPDAYLSSPAGQAFMREMDQLALNGSPQVNPPTYTDSYGGGP